MDTFSEMEGKHFKIVERAGSRRLMVFFGGYR